MSVTVIVATYARPDALTKALTSLQMQTMTDWRAIVVGDCCGPETAAALAELGDARIRYVNLPLRSGEQSGPNSVGVRLADTPYVAFLNHDDIWLPDHLEIGLAALERTGGDFFAGRAVFAFSRKQHAAGIGPSFSEISPLERTLISSFYAARFIFEPASAWLMRKSLAERVGDWRHSSLLYRTPLEDWLLRAARAGAVLALDERVSVLKVTTHASAQGRLYDWDASDQDFMLNMIRTQGVAGVRAFLDTEFAASAARGSSARDPNKRILGEDATWLAERLLTPATAEVYIRTGWDAQDVVSQLSHDERGALIRATLKKRTGEELTHAPTIDELMQFVRSPA